MLLNLSSRSTIFDSDFATSEPASKSVDHAGFGVRGAACEDKWKRRKCVDLFVGQLIEISGFLDDGCRYVCR
jgi:hypothetical protein